MEGLPVIAQGQWASPAEECETLAEICGAKIAGVIQWLVTPN
jgi:hypothetical protein